MFRIVTIGVACIVSGASLSAQQVQPSLRVPRLVRVGNTFHPANGLSISPVESVTFSIYHDEQGGTPLWSETQNVAVDPDGRYSALMGSTLPDGIPLDLFASEEPRWLGVQFNRSAEIEQPRVLLVSVPYALKASDADTLGGKPASAYLLDPNAATGIGSNGSGSSTASAAGAAGVAIAGKTLKPRSVTGDMNYLPYFIDSSNDLGNSVAYQNNGRIGLNTTSPLDFLHVRFTNTNGAFTGYAVQNLGNTATSYSGMLFFDQNGALGQFQGFNNVTHEYRINNIASSGSINFMLGSVSKFLVAPSGNIGIGNTSPAFAVDVAGTVNAYNSATSGNGNAVQGTANGANGVGVEGFNNASSGYANGVSGGTNSPNGAGVYGFNNATSGGFPTGVTGNVNGTNGAGISGNAQQAGAVGVSGYNSATSGNAVGVVGTTVSNAGSGVQGNAQQAGAVGIRGNNSATSGYAVGVQGNTSSTNGAGVQGGTSQATAYGVIGNNNATSGYAVGVSGNTGSTGGAGVQGNAHNGGAFGVVGFNSATSGWAIGTQGASSSPGGVGLLGVDWDCSGGTGCNLVPGTALQLQTATTGTLIEGLSGTAAANNNTATTVFSVDGTGAGYFGGGVVGISNSALPSGNPGVAGLSTATSGVAVGIGGVSSSPAGSGVAGISGTCGSVSCSLINGTAGSFYTSSASGGYLLQGFSGATGNDFLTGTSQVFYVDGQGDGYFKGSLTVGGNISKGGGSFRIDHPLDPENKYLYHSFVESPDMKNIYDGVATLDDRGEATVQLPEWFEALNEDFRYQLTCIGGYAPVYVASEVSGNQFRIAGGKSGLKISWQVTGIRHDAYANAHRIPVEALKSESARRTATSPDSATPATAARR